MSDTVIVLHLVRPAVVVEDQNFEASALQVRRIDLKDKLFIELRTKCLTMYSSLKNVPVVRQETYSAERVGT